MTDDQAIQALTIFGVGSVLGAAFGGVKGFQIGAAISGALAVEMLEKGQGVALLCKALGIAPPAPEEQTVYDAIPVFDDAPPARPMLLLGEGVKHGRGN